MKKKKKKKKNITKQKIALSLLYFLNCFYDLFILITSLKYTESFDAELVKKCYSKLA